MTAFFGIEEHNAQGFLDKNIVCLPRSPEDKPDLHSIVSAIKSEVGAISSLCVRSSAENMKYFSGGNKDHIETIQYASASHRTTPH